MTHSSASTAVPSLRDHIIILADAYAKKTGKSDRWISKLTFSDHKKIHLVRGGADITTRSYEKALQIFSDNWPERTAWPSVVKRPQKSQQAA